jgi:hypothetical protein
MRNPFQRCKCDESQFISCIFIFIDGIVSIIDGASRVLTLGFYSTWFEMDWAVWRTRWQMNRKIEADKGGKSGGT